MKANLLAKFSEKAMTVGGKAIFKAKANSPQILFGVGVVCVIGAAVTAGVASRKIDDIVDKHKEAMEAIKAEVEDKNELQRLTTVTYGRTVLEVAKLFAPTAILLSVGIGCFGGSFHILRKRNAVLLAAYTALEDSYNTLYDRVVEEHGEETAQMYANGIRQEEVKKTEVDENGKKKTTKEKVEVPEGPLSSPYAKFFDESSTYWKKGNSNANMLYLKTQQDEWNRVFRNRAEKGNGFVFLNEIYTSLDIPQTPTGAICGWLWDDEGDNYIDFGIFEGDSFAQRRFVNGYEDCVLLDFNCQGKIVDKI